MDGTETVVLAGQRVFTRPDLPLLAELKDADARRSPRGSEATTCATGLVPVGQDAAFAPLAARFVTAGGVVQGFARSIARHVAVARAEPLAPGAPLAADHGTSSRSFRAP